MKKTILFLLFFICSFSGAVAQTVDCHRLYLNNKNNSPYSVNRPGEFLSLRAVKKRERFKIPITEEDFPVNSHYISIICSIDASIKILAKSKWFNTVVISVPNTYVMETIKSLSFVDSAVLVANLSFEQVKQDYQKEFVDTDIFFKDSFFPLKSETGNRYSYGAGYKQIAMHNGHLLHNEGFAGEGMLIAVFDAGWENFNSIPYFQSLYDNGQIKGTIDLIPFIGNVYTGHSHGTAVTSTMATSAEGEFVGTAPKADYFFIRSEHPYTEQPIEEDFWAMAAEIADSLGADVINSSLGYTRFIDFIALPYNAWSYKQSDGNSSIASLAAAKAGTKGVIPCISAGNEGESDWHYIGRPADASDVLSVGAVDTFGKKAPFSSYGPSYDGRIKPDVLAIGYETMGISSEGVIKKINGTSFASPVIAGLTACFWQAFPEKSATEIMQIIRKSGDCFQYPSDSLGYGKPDFYKAYLQYKKPKPIPEDGVILFPNPCDVQLNIVNKEHDITAIAIYDITGKFICSQEITTPQTLLRMNTVNLPSGIYLCEITKSEAKGILKFVKF